MSTNTYQRETDEFQPITVTVKTRNPDGTETTNIATTGVTFAVVPAGQRPAIFLEPMTLEGKIGVNVVGLGKGSYSVFARIQSTPEIPVIHCGTFRVQ